MSITIELQNDTKIANIPSLKQFQDWFREILTTIPSEIDKNKKILTIRIVDEEESALLNETYHRKKGPTNILSFPDDPIPGFSSESFGDLAICAPLIIKEATQQHKKIEACWAHLFVHGVLHLLDYDHINEKNAHVMEALEIKILQKLGFNNPYEGRY